ncbi:MAG: hypothetical protein E7258_03500 [Lachnospiraceae bacterium]|nr:hypothetical protein [Lachnospiraceae bacterium]
MFTTDNRGVATVEATLILPFFIFAMLSIYRMAQCRIAENIIYDASIETAEYLSELAYIDENAIYGPELIFSKYVDDSDFLDTYIVDGTSGINFLGTTGVDEDGYFILKVNYSTKVIMPFMPSLSQDKTISIKKRAYTGNIVSEDNADSSGDRYVYITDYMSVYHNSRTCTYLDLSTQVSGKKEAEARGLSLCEFCPPVDVDKVIVTDFGERYHTRRECSGLKRTIYRVKLKDVEGMGECSRCGSGN